MSTYEPGAPRPPLLARVGPRQWSVIDAVVALSYAALAASVERASSAEPLLVVAVAALTAAAILLSRARPVIGLAVALVAAMLAPLQSEVGWLTLAPVGYGLWRIAVDDGLVRAAVATTVAMLAPLATGLPDFRHDGAIVPFALVLLICTAIGLAVGGQRRYSAGVHRHEQQRTAMAVAEGREALLAERLKLARELHDVVAHTLSIVTVQAAYGHLVFDDQPTQARNALQAIETAGREASQEMRRLLDVLREEGAALEPALAPSAGLADLPRLVEQATSAGVAVTLEVSGDDLPLPPGLELTVFRIVQEALTNVVRHAHADSAVVSVTVEPDLLCIKVSDRGRGSTESSTEGHGLVGMRERVELYGGRLSAGNQTDGNGFAVEVELPLVPAAEPALT